MMGCNDNGTGPNDGAGSVYFPLHLGNAWTYRNISFYLDTSGIFIYDTSFFSLMIDSTIKKNGKTYFRLTREPGYVNSQQGADSAFYRLAENGDVYLLVNDTESMYLKFSAPIDSAWTFSINDSVSGTLSIISKSDSVSTPLGVFRNCISIGPNVDPRLRPGEVSYYYPSIGYVATKSWNIRSGIRISLTSYSLK
jgi:hypothetical protein